MLHIISIKGVVVVAKGIKKRAKKEETKRNGDESETEIAEEKRKG